MQHCSLTPTPPSLTARQARYSSQILSCLEESRTSYWLQTTSDVCILVKAILKNTDKWSEQVTKGRRFSQLHHTGECHCKPGLVAPDSLPDSKTKKTMHKSTQHVFQCFRACASEWETLSENWSARSFLCAYKTSTFKNWNAKFQSCSLSMVVGGPSPVE